MLNVMRDNLRHLKWVLVIVAVAMLGYLGSYFDPRVKRGGPSAEWAAKVDGQTISSQEFVEVARNQDDYYHRLLGAQYEPMKKNLKLGSQAIQTLVDRQLVLAEARALGLTATKDAISRAILENPSFKDPSGSFVGKERYADYIGQSVDGGVEAYERRLGEDILAKRYLEVMTVAARVSDAELDKTWRQRNVKAAAEYVFVPATSVASDTTVDAATVSAWYAAHANDYKRSEARKAKMIVIDRQGQIANANVSDADVDAAVRAEGTTPSNEVKDATRRRLELQRAQQLAVAEARRLAAEIKTPADLDAVAAKAGLKVEERVLSPEDRAADLGPSPEFTSGVATMIAGQVSTPFAVARGVAIVACSAVIPAGQRLLSEVESKVKEDVLSDRGHQAAAATARRIAASATLAEGAKPLKLEVKKTGDLSMGADIAGVGHIVDLDAAIFGAAVAVGSKGALPAPGGAIAYTITRHDVFDAAKFESDKASIREQLLQERRDQLAEGLIQSLRQRHTIEINQPLVASVDGVNG